MSTFTLLFPRIRNMVGVLAYLAILSACNSSATSVETPSPILPAPTWTTWPTVTPTSPVPDSFPVEDVSEQYVGVFELDLGFESLPAGTYLVGEGKSDDVLYYFTIDGARYGKIGSITSAIPPFGRSPAFSFFMANTTPVFLKVNAENRSSRLDNEISSGRILIQKTDLLNGDMVVWLATTESEEDMTCDPGYISSDRRWYYGNCWRKGENYIYLLDLLSGSGRYLYSSQYPCRTAQLSYSEGWTRNVGFDENGTSMQADCRDSERGFYMHCSISLDSGAFSCAQADYDQSDFYFYPYSPDGSKVVARVYPTGEEKHSYLFITDWECIVDSASCTEYVRAPIGDGSSLYYEVGMAWNQSGSRFIWSTVPMTADKIKPYSRINIANIETGEVRSFDWPRGAVLIGISPDDQWLVLRNDDDLMLISMNGQTLRRLPRPGGQPASFLGWLVIP